MREILHDTLKDVVAHIILSITFNKNSIATNIEHICIHETIEKL